MQSSSEKTCLVKKSRKLKTPSIFETSKLVNCSLKSQLLLFTKKEPKSPTLRLSSSKSLALKFFCRLLLNPLGCYLTTAFSHLQSTRPLLLTARVAHTVTSITTVVTLRRTDTCTSLAAPHTTNRLADTLSHLLAHCPLVQQLMQSHTTNTGNTSPELRTQTQ